MVEIVVLSGKGGTGKTSLAASFAHLAGHAVICDQDVDAPDLHLLLQPASSQTTEFWSGNEARVDPAKCQNCGECIVRCRFNAISEQTDHPHIDPLKCEGCKVCVTFCPHDALLFPQKHCGNWYVSQTRFGVMVHAQLFPGEENSGRLVAVLRQTARDLAQQQGAELVLGDGPPGIGCPVISSLTGTSLAVIVTEPTVSGLHDLKRIVELCRHFNVDAGIVINKFDLNLRLTARLEDYCQQEDLPLFGRLPHDLQVTQAMVAGKTITEFGTGNFVEQVHHIWNRIWTLAKLPAAA
jgi:MinD superfamily P-loop ATPase